MTIKLFKNFLKILIPPHIRVNLRRVQEKIFVIEKEWKGMKNSEVFDNIYLNGIWGKNIDGSSTSGEGSHSSEIINPYITEISKFLSQVESNTIVDLGCGDFNVGKNFVPLTKKYIACDVSNVILKRNKIKYNSFSNLEFKFLDLSEDPLPKGDVCFVRQVLQHLSNENINKFVKKINLEKPYKHIVVTEYLTQNDNFIANLDKSVGANTRHMVGSGVVLHEEPFNLEALSIKDLLEVTSEGGKIKTTIYKF